MDIKKNTYFITNKASAKKLPESSLIGIRGKQAYDLIKMDLPVVPGFIINTDISSKIQKEENLIDNFKQFFDYYKKLSGKVFDSPDNPMLLKIVMSSNLAIASYPTLHNFGLAENTFEGFSKFVGEDFANHEILFMLNGYLQVELRIAELLEDNKTIDKYRKSLSKLKILNTDKKIDYTKIISGFKNELDPALFRSATEQLELVLKRISYLIELEDTEDIGVAILVQPMVYGNYGKDSYSGNFTTRNAITGEGNITGEFFKNKFNSAEFSGKPIKNIDKKYFNEFVDIASKLEVEYHEIRKVGFTIESGRLSLINQNPINEKSTRADIKLLLDLNNKKAISDKDVINGIKPGQLNELLHPVIDLTSVKNFKKVEGGISGAPGAAIGRVFFSTEALLDEYKTARLNDKDDRLILCLVSSFAEDVKAIEVASGVLSSEGGYSAHASVVARQYGKVSLVNPALKISGKKALIGGMTIKEGDTITLNVPDFSEPSIYFGEAGLIQPDPSKNGLIEFSKIVKKNISNFEIRANCDKASDAKLALAFGADGIGLCRTEHMFFDESRINVFREMIFSEDDKKRKAVLKKLKTMQKKDFTELFKVMDGKEVNIRLLDSPLHEFLPHNPSEIKTFLDYMKKSTGKPFTEKMFKEKAEAFREFNPMLGHRGCRIAVSYPEIYQMQVEAVFEAAYELQAKKIKVKPEIMVPIIMNEAELKMIVYGKKIEGSQYPGLIDVEKETRLRMKAKPIDFKVGTMIELPAAALSAGNIARYAEFFSFGTNDLTQTTLGLSRDDFTSFMPDYTLYDILSGNPFRTLEKPVKELIARAIQRGTITRPDLLKGLCGEHGAAPENIEFCIDVGLDYVSCSTYSVPIAALSAAQVLLKRSE
ncbi:MAG: PEP-utilizing enzyme [Spirochaetales bacterium]|uniref:Pyruvate, phosphate dikinase n=1 Tax=Candidatus Thalassospirochaeta sargassi TaxID=3119039 RepID=A0AAJ1IDA3_9SPIO|nr:PEP-utilizing enzyme [Spirochaetales bacterium]